MSSEGMGCDNMYVYNYRCTLKFNMFNYLQCIHYNK